MDLKPGIYEGMPFDDYAAIEALSQSRLSWLIDESPAYYKHRLEHHEDESSAMRFGSAAHCAALEPLAFTARYASEPDITTIINPKNDEPYKSPRSSKPYKDAVAEIEAEGRIVLTRPDYDGALAIMAAVRNHPRVGKLIDDAKGFETTLVWERDGLLCKARLDFWGDGWLADLKTTRNLSGFSPWEITKYSLHRQMAWYHGGMLSCGLNVEVDYLAAVGNICPEVGLFALDLGSIDAGRQEIKRGWELYRKCLDADDWPGRFPNSVMTATITDRRFDRVTEDAQL